MVHPLVDYNILNIVVNTERYRFWQFLSWHYNILNIVVNTEPSDNLYTQGLHYNILNIVVNTERCIIRKWIC